jgi:uncharacterized RDD family membrane protein YckC
VRTRYRRAVAASPDERRHGLGDAVGRAAFYPARAAARAWRGRIESAADDVLSAPEVARILDRALAGSLPEDLARSLVRHRVLERVVQELAETGELERLVREALASPRTVELTDRVLASDEMQRAIGSVASSAELRKAVARQSAGLAEQVVGSVRTAAKGLDDRTEGAARLHGRMPRSVYGGVVTRAVALAIDSMTALAIFAVISAVVAMIASLVGGIHPQWAAGTVLGGGWLLIGGGYFTLFWSAGGQTPGMSLMHVRVRRPDGRGLSVLRAFVRTVGLALAIIPFFLGFVPALFDPRRRALPDYLAGTVVLYEPEAPAEEDDTIAGLSP